VRLRGRLSGGGAWIDLDEDAHPLSKLSRGAAKVLHTRTGVDYRIKVTFKGDARNLVDATPWIYFRKVLTGPPAPTRSDRAHVPGSSARLEVREAVVGGRDHHR
jgi:hypothetical protein